MKNTIRRIQHHLGLVPDGIMGPITLQALARKLGLEKITTWPTQAQIRSGTSIFGSPGNEGNLTSIIPPYQLYFEGKPVRTIRVHHLIAPHVSAALAEVLQHYGANEIHRLGFDDFGGCYNFRPTTTGKALSMHAWGIALDFAPRANAYALKSPRASLSHPDCDTWWQIWEKHGAVSLGRRSNMDWMHLQFAEI